MPNTLSESCPSSRIRLVRPPRRITLMCAMPKRSPVREDRRQDFLGDYRRIKLFARRVADVASLAVVTIGITANRFIAKVLEQVSTSTGS